MRRLYMSGLSLDEVGSAFGRSASAIEARVFKLSLRRLSRHRWTDESQALLASLVAAGKSIRAISAPIGLSEDAVQMRMHRTGLRVTSRSRTLDEDAIAEAIESGQSQAPVARLYGVKQHRIQSIVRSLGVVNKRCFSVCGELESDDAMIEMSIAGVSNAEIARRLGVSRGRVDSRLVTLARRDAIADFKAEQSSLSSPRRRISSQNTGAPA